MKIIRGTYIAFVEVLIPGRKTNVWYVQTKATPITHIGAVGWHCPWRKYVFKTCPNAVFEEVCLREIADFLERQTREHKRARRAHGRSAEARAAGDA
jgi:hypothetical protein